MTKKKNTDEPQDSRRWLTEKVIVPIVVALIAALVGIYAVTHTKEQQSVPQNPKIPPPTTQDKPPVVQEPGPDDQDKESSPPKEEIRPPKHKPQTNKKIFFAVTDKGYSDSAHKKALIFYLSMATQAYSIVGLEAGSKYSQAIVFPFPHAIAGGTLHVTEGSPLRFVWNVPKPKGQLVFVQSEAKGRTSTPIESKGTKRIEVNVNSVVYLEDSNGPLASIVVKVVPRKHEERAPDSKPMDDHEPAAPPSPDTASPNP